MCLHVLKLLTKVVSLTTTVHQAYMRHLSRTTSSEYRYTYLPYLLFLELRIMPILSVGDGLCRLGTGWLTPGNSATSITHAKYGHSSSSNGRIVRAEIRGKTPPHVPPCKRRYVRGTETDRSGTYNFLLVNHRPIYIVPFLR